MGSENNMVAVAQCSICGGKTFAAVDVRQFDGTYAPGPERRCVECKTTFTAQAFARLAQPDAQQGASSPASGEGVERLRQIVEVIANADSEDCVGSLDIDIPRNGYPRQWLRDAARAELATPLAAAIQPAVPQEDAMRDAIVRAYTEGATAVHEHWQEVGGEAPRGVPEFGEAASDYARAALTGAGENGEQGA